MTTSKYDFLHSSSLTAEPPLYSSLNRLMKHDTIVASKGLLRSIYLKKQKNSETLNI